MQKPNRTLLNPTVYLKRNYSSPLPVGPRTPTRLNVLIGASVSADLNEERRKIDALKELNDDAPDIVTDLSIVKESKGNRLWEQVIQKTSFVAATVPIYLANSKNGKIDPNELLDIVTEQMESGVGLITIHATPNRDLIRQSSNRLIPYTSRGGGLVISDIIASSRHEGNVYTCIFEDLITTAKRTGSVISLGTTFRPGSIFDALDEVHRKELEIQIQLGALIKSAGVGVIVEGPGHCRPRDIYKVSSLLQKTGMPVMALGPLPLDSAVGQDHIAGAIGAALLGLQGCAHVLSIVTREEHTGGIPRIESIIEALKAAKVVSKIIDLEILKNEENEFAISRLRAKSRTCVAGKQSQGCERCNSQCPLQLNQFVLKEDVKTRGPHS